MGYLKNNMLEMRYFATEFDNVCLANRKCQDYVYVKWRTKVLCKK